TTLKNFGTQCHHDDTFKPLSSLLRGPHAGLERSSLPLLLALIEQECAALYGNDYHRSAASRRCAALSRLRRQRASARAAIGRQRSQRSRRLRTPRGKLWLR